MSSRRDFLKTLLLAGAATTFAPAILTGKALDDLPWFNAQADGPWEIFMPTILAAIKRPKFPNRTFNITKFGAQGDGRTDCTAAFRWAIAECTRSGGGHVVVPAGDYLT